jgi:hypothetical protein
MESYLEAAGKRDVQVVPVFFCGKLRDSVWLPEWMCETPQLDPKPLDYFRERDLIRAQQLQIDIVAGAFAHHGAILGWDLGRDTTRWALELEPDVARSHLLWLLEALKRKDETHPVTLTLSQSDFEQDRGIRPSGLAEELDFLSIRVAPHDRSASVHGSDAAGFYCDLARTLSGKPVLISELVVPDGSEDEEAERYVEQLESARQSGALGALAWSDDGSVPASFGRFAVSESKRIEASFRIHVKEAHFYAAPGDEIHVAYAEFLKNRERADDSHDLGLLAP